MWVVWAVFVYTSRYMWMWIMPRNFSFYYFNKFNRKNAFNETNTYTYEKSKYIRCHRQRCRRFVAGPGNFTITDTDTNIDTLNNSANYKFIYDFRKWTWKSLMRARARAHITFFFHLLLGFYIQQRVDNHRKSWPRRQMNTIKYSLSEFSGKEKFTYPKMCTYAFIVVVIVHCGKRRNCFWRRTNETAAVNDENYG